MSNAINRSTMEYVESINTPDYDISEWIINPTLPDCDAKYWKIVDDNVIEMTKDEKSKKDADIISAERWIPKNKMDILNNIWKSYSGDDLMRIVGVLNSHTVFGYFLEDYSYTTARGYLTGLIDSGEITQADYDIIDGILPYGGQ